MTPEHTTPVPSDEALEAALRVAQVRRLPGNQAAVDQIVSAALTAAYAIDAPRLRAGATGEAPEPVYEWRAVFPNSDGSRSVQPLAKAPRPGTRMLVEGHNRGWVERRHAVAWERVEEGTER